MTPNETTLLEAIDVFAKWAVIFVALAALAVCAGTGAYVFTSGACIAKPGQTVECPNG